MNQPIQQQPRPSAAIEQMRNLTRTLRTQYEEPEAARLRATDAAALAAVIESLSWALSDWLNSVNVHEAGASYTATRRPQYVDGLAEKVKDVARFARKSAATR